MNTNPGLSIWNNGMGPLGELRREVDRFFNDYGPCRQLGARG